MAITVLASTQQLQNDLDKWVRRDGEGNENGEMEKTVKQKKKKKIRNVECKFYLPIKDPHWLAGTIKRSGICVLPFDVLTSLNWEHHCNGIIVDNDNKNEREKNTREWWWEHVKKFIVLVSTDTFGIKKLFFFDWKN